MLGPLIGIEIGTKNLKMLYGCDLKKTFRVKQCAIIELPEGVISDGNIMNRDILIKKISSFIIANKIKTKKVMLNVQSTSIITRELVIPKVRKKELEGIIELEKQEHFPIDISDYQVNYKINRILKDAEGKENYEIMLIAVLKSFTDKYIQLFEAMNLEVIGMDITDNSLARFFETESFCDIGEEKKSIAIIDIGDKTTNVIITSEGSILFSRAIMYGLSELNSVLENEFADKIEKDIEKFKKTYTALYVGDTIRSDDVYGCTISNTIKPIIENNLITEMNRFIEFYHSKFRKIPITELYIVGGGAYIKNIDVYMKSIFKLEVVLEKDIGLMCKNNKKRVINDGNVFYFISLIGLLNNASTRKLNLLPKGYWSIIKDKKNRHYIVLASAFVILVILLLGRVPDLWLAQKNELLIRINQRINDPKFKEVVLARNEMNQTQLNLNKQKNIINSIDNQSVVGSEIIQQIVGALPTNINIKTITVADATKHISIAGVVSVENEYKVLEYVVNLQRIYGFRNVDFEVPFEKNLADQLNTELSYTIDLDLAAEWR